MARRIQARFVRVHEDMPDHPKIEGLSDAAFRLLVTSWCWCRRNPKQNGHIPAASWAKRGSARARGELIAAGLVDDDLMKGAIVHDWDDWQLTSDEIDQATADKVKAGDKGAHVRWHEKPGRPDPNCELCRPRRITTAMGDR